MGSYTSLLVKQLDGRLTSSESQRTASLVRLAVIPSLYEALRDLGTFTFFVYHLFSVSRIYMALVAELQRLIERLEDIHTKVQGVIS